MVYVAFRVPEMLHKPSICIFVVRSSFVVPSCLAVGKRSAVIASLLIYLLVESYTSHSQTQQTGADAYHTQDLVPWVCFFQEK